MTRKELLSQLARCSSLMGYPFTTGLTYRINTELLSPPEVWAEPPRLISRSGRNEGTKDYSLTLRLIDIPQGPQDAEQLLNSMEESLFQIMEQLCSHPQVVKTEDVEYTTEENTLTNRGEVSVRAVFTIQTRF
ncbi:MAG: hypothetical protein LUE10_03830 [Alistipes sp.]|nr:hypothetical protein [Alistipes sp.]